MVQDRECYNDGSIRNGYSSGDIIDPNSGLIRWPVILNKQNNDDIFVGDDQPLWDGYARGRDTGNLAWAALALVQAHEILTPQHDRYLQAATKIANWIVENHSYNMKTDKPSCRPVNKGYSGGYEQVELGQNKITYRSTEHNLDLVALFRHLARAYHRNTKARAFWEAQEQQALQFVQAMWQQEKEYFQVGTQPGSQCVNTSVKALDVQTWAMLALGDRTYINALPWAIKNCKARNISNAFDFNCQADGDGGWWEGTAQLALALSLYGYEKIAESIHQQLREVQIRDSNAAGAIPAASKDGLTTGIEKKWGKWVYNNEAHIGATAWYIFAALKKNPYYLLNSHN
jgi:hypothetical protein